MEYLLSLVVYVTKETANRVIRHNSERVFRKLTLSFQWMVISIPVWIATEVMADVRMPPIFCDHMVVQHDAPMPIWGMAEVGEKVTVRFAGQSHTETTDPQGKWLIRLDPIQVSAEGRILTISSNRGANLKINDVLVGEVWFCAGQSNMEMGLGEVANGTVEIGRAEYPGIRLFQVQINHWQVCTPASIAQGNGTGYGLDGAGGFSAVGYFFGREIHNTLRVPVGLINVTAGGTLLDQWMAPDGAQYQEKVAPIVPLAVRGLLWYQGEADCANHKSATYAERFKAFIEGWRRVWEQEDFPVYYVQVAPFNYVKHNSVRTPFELPLLWEAQASALTLKNNGMAVISDLGEVENIHPVQKEGVGHRLALLALAKTYGKQDLVCSGPVFRSMKVEGNSVRIFFDGTGSGLASRDGKPLTWFEIADESGKFIVADALIEGQSILVSSKELSRPVAVRFSWNQVAQPNLINVEGLPAAPFRTKY